MEEILSRHKKELKLLQGEIMQLKKSVGKGSASKSKKKEIDQQIVNMELDLKQRHEKELQLAQESIADGEKANAGEVEALQEREKRESEFEAMRAEAAKEAELMPDKKELEMRSIERYLEPLNLKIKQFFLMPDEFDSYCQEMSTGAVWGGQSEIQAICQALQLQIHVIQMDSIVVKLGQEFENCPPLQLSYHRYSYGLGEHYKYFFI
ncbi:OTU domain-containing protein 6B [Boothiomyces sp. JEL0838]|nr:OTU domain-containing protein 6B [Boothiomyces sp. JEL0838]